MKLIVETMKKIIDPFGIIMLIIISSFIGLIYGLSVEIHKYNIINSFPNGTCFSSLGMVIHKFDSPNAKVVDVPVILTNKQIFNVTLLYPRPGESLVYDVNYWVEKVTQLDSIKCNVNVQTNEAWEKSSKTKTAYIFYIIILSLMTIGLFSSIILVILSIYDCVLKYISKYKRKKIYNPYVTMDNTAILLN